VIARFLFIVGTLLSTCNFSRIRKFILIGTRYETDGL
jgi:hypothetical protein